MEEQTPQQQWSEYYLRIEARRTDEAKKLWSQMRAAGVEEDTVLALDFRLFANSEEDARSLAQQLSANYKIDIIPATEDGYWFVDGTTRPEGIILTESQHIDWVKFMVDVGRSYASVFSAWGLEAPSLNRKFQSVDIEG